VKRWKRTSSHQHSWRSMMFVKITMIMMMITPLQLQQPMTSSDPSHRHHSSLSVTSRNPVNDVINSRAAAVNFYCTTSLLRTSTTHGVRFLSHILDSVSWHHALSPKRFSVQNYTEFQRVLMYFCKKHRNATQSHSLLLYTVSGVAAAPTHQHTFPTVDRRAETRRP